MLNLGVIEGFYGRTWSWQERHDMVDFLASEGFGSYWYAPKADVHLRKQWDADWPADTFASLQALAAHCADRKIHFGIGLSPLGLYNAWRHGGGRDALLRRLQQIRQIQPGGMALLFDDMQGDLPGLAEVQADMVHCVAGNLQVGQLVMCPGYYSFDPVLEELFGSMPDNYWADLGRLLDPSIDIFWTGDKVISHDYPLQGLQAITQHFRRKPLIWDNSIVNDGRKTSPFLPVQPMYDPAAFASHVAGIVVNPKNAPALSQIPLATLGLNGSDDQRFQQALALKAPELAGSIMDCLPLFLEKGRDNIDDKDRQKLESCFRQSENPVARDIMAWLDGAFRFDPACLT